MTVNEKRMIVFIFILFLFGLIFGEEVDQQNGGEDILKKLLDIKVNTASKYSQTVNQAPASVTIITSEEIQRFGYRTIDDIIAKIRGFYITNDHNYSYIGVRGFSRPSDYNNRVLLLLNGVSLAENVYGSSLFGTEFGLDIDVIDRIEVVRGPSSALYGTNAMMAVINIITRDGKTEEGLKTTLQGGSFGKIQAGIRLGKELKKGWNTFASAFFGNIHGQDYYFKEFDDPSTHNGLAENIDQDRYHGLFALLNYKDFSFQGFWSSRKKIIPTAPYNTLFNDPREYSIDSQSSIELKYSTNLSYNTKLTLRKYFGSYYYKGAYPQSDPDALLLQEDKSVGIWHGLEGQFGWDIRANNRLIVGIEYKNNPRSTYKYWDEWGIHFDTNRPFHQWSCYVQDELQIVKNLAFIISARYDWFSDRGHALNPRLAVIYNPSQATTIKLLYGNAFRAPNFYELYYEVKKEAKPNPGLLGEKIRTLETIVEHSFSKHISSVFSLYSYEFLKPINPIDVPCPQPEDENLMITQFQNGPKIKAFGMEAEVNIHLANGWIGYVNYSFQTNKSLLTDTRLTNSPSHLAKSGLSIPLWRLISLSGELFYESKRLTLTGIYTDPYFLVNIHVCADHLLPHFVFSFHVKNLFNTRYYLPGGTEHTQPALIQGSRCLTLKIEYSL